MASMKKYAITVNMPLKKVHGTQTFTIHTLNTKQWQNQNFH